MPDGSDSIAIKIVERIGDLPAAEWDACAGGDDPFTGHAFLSALEDAGCVSAASGWLPRHMAVLDDTGGAIAVAPLYVKGHSQGEYVFDWGWADAYERAGGRYYPKLQCAVPFSPVPGRRLLARPGPSGAPARAALADGLVELARRHGLSSVHCTFCSEDEAALLADRSWLVRHGVQFHWPNRGYATFDEFLATLMSRKRKAIQKERRAVADAGIRLPILAGDEIKAHHWDAFHRFYVDTYDRKWGYPYLNREFFGLLSERLGDRVVLVTAEHDGDMIAGALNLRGEHALYGRNWGAGGNYPFLHFEACYYRAMDFAIANRIGRVEAGTQGPHKIQRGYLPVLTYSAHWIADPGLRQPVADFVTRERSQMAREMTELSNASPYRSNKL